MAKTGRPLKYKNAKDLEDAIESYFAKCEGEILRDDNGELIYNKFGDPVKISVVPPTITGLALHLGFATRLSLINYQGKAEFVNTVTRAKARCEAYAESRLYDRDGARGAEFSLRCNFKWSDKSDEAAQETLAKLDTVLEKLDGNV